MNTEDVFWEMVKEVGSSEEEIKKFCIEVQFKDNGIVRMYASRMNQLGLVETKEVYKDEHNWNFSVVFHDTEINLHDPNSISKLKQFIDSVRENKHPRIKEFNMDVRLDDVSVETKQGSGWSLTTRKVIPKNDLS